MPSVLEAITPLMNDSIGVTATRGVFRTLPTSVQAAVGSLDVVEVRELLAHLETSSKLFALNGKPVPLGAVRSAMTGGVLARERMQRFTIATDGDVLVVQRATQALTRSFFSMTDCVRLATAASELARNIYMYAKLGSVTLRLVDELSAYRFEISADDNGPGISNLDVILSGTYRSRTGLGRGIVGTKALLDELKVDSAPGKGTHITGMKRAKKT